MISGSKQPFARRIVIAFTLMTLVVSGIFSLSIVGIVQFIEGYLASQELGRELDAIINQDLKKGLPPRLDYKTYFFATNNRDYQMPDVMYNIPEGFTEMVKGNEAYYAYMRVIDGERYLLMEEQHEMEARERALLDVVLAGFLISVAVAWLLGWLLARRVMAPITKLANQVRRRDQLARPLAPQYANDEVGRLAAAFDDAIGQLHKSLERERLFTSDVSHELRTPLMVIQGSCELLGEADLPPRAKDQVARIRRAADEMHDLVQTFLLLARDNAEESVFSSSTSLLGIAEEQEKRWGPKIIEKGLAFEVAKTGADEGIYNAPLLRAVMSNLLRNALHYTESGKVRLVLENGGFHVEDTGIGIPADQQARMFQPFVRGEHARGEGLGLGLSIVKRICQHQGWRVCVHSNAPRGTCFTVSFKRDALCQNPTNDCQNCSSNATGAPLALPKP